VPEHRATLFKGIQQKLVLNKLKVTMVNIQWKITRLAKEHKYTPVQEKNQSIEIDPEMIEMMELTNKNCKTDF
jgi:hypothetical protein